MDDGYGAKSMRNPLTFPHLTQVDRLNTFVDWPISNPSPVVLSKLGFIYIGCEDEVQCINCLKHIRNWSKKGNPLVEHYKLDNRCKFVTDFSHILLEICVKTTQNFPIKKFFESLENRISSFKDANLPSFLSVDSLAHAGFYYLGPGDRVGCYSCDIILLEWEVSDIPIGEHYRWNADCMHVQTCLRHLDENLEKIMILGLPFIDPVETKPNVLQSIFARENLPNGNLSNESLGISTSRPIARYGRGISTSSLTPENHRESLITQPTEDETAPELFKPSYLLEELKNYTANTTLHQEQETASERECEEIRPTNEIENEEENLILSKIYSSPQVLAVKEIYDFPQNIIENVIRKHYRINHEEFDSAAELCSAILEEIEENPNCESDDISKNKIADSKTEGANAKGHVLKSEKKLVVNSSNDGAKNQQSHKKVSDEGCASILYTKLGIDQELSNSLCKICMDNEVAVIFLDCRHLVTCEECSKLVKECPICRRPILERMKIFMS